MHNVLLGSAKHMMMLWKENKIVTEAHFTNIQVIVGKFVTPVDIGRIPYKIASGFSAFTADQWKNWSSVYSLIAMKDILPDSRVSSTGGCRGEASPPPPKPSIFPPQSNS